MNWISIGAIFSGLSVMLGAMGAHSLKNILDYQPVDALSDELIQSQLASKAVAFDHLTYLLLTQNRWLSP